MTDDILPGLGWIESPADDRDWPVGALYAAAGEDPALAIPDAYHVPAPLYPVLDQGSTPQCVAFSAAGEQGWYDLRDTGLALFDEAAFFAQIGGTSSGAYIRDALAKRLAAGYPIDLHPELAGQHRIAAYYAVPVARADICAAILAFGPVVIGTPWPSSWFRPVAGVLPPFDSASGGHAILAVGWDATGLRLRNSWGADWGQAGEATMRWSDLGHVRECWKAIDAVVPKPAPKPYEVRIAANAVVRMATISASGCIAAWTDRRWGPNASAAPCRQPVVKRGCYSGQATVAYVTKGVFAGRWVRIGYGVTVTGG